MPYDIINEVVVRSPKYSFNNNLSVEDLFLLLHNESFLEAIYIASPQLYDECIKLRNNEIKIEKKKNKVLSSLYRYYSRMSTRSTPFGLFSTCEVNSWGALNTADSQRSFYRHTRLDMHTLQTLAIKIARFPVVSQSLLYYPNNSIYTIGEEYRYTEYTILNGFKKYNISAIRKNRYLTQILCDSINGLRKDGLIVSLVEQGIPNADAAHFVEQLINSQVLISQFEVALTSNDDFIVQIIGHLEDIQANAHHDSVAKVLAIVRELANSLKALDNQEVNDISRYREIIEKIKSIDPEIDEAKVFHVDSYRKNILKKSIRENAKEEILEVLNFLLMINNGSRYYNKNLVDFKQKFSERYESQIVELSKVLDDDIGIGYPINRKIASSPMVDNIPFNHNQHDKSVQLGETTNWLLKVIIEAPNQYSIQLDGKWDPSASQQSALTDLNYLPQSMSAFFRLLDDGDQTMLFENFAGTSAAALLGRFTYGNEELRKIAEEVVSKEILGAENCILAEIVHLPDNRVTNVIMHPPFLAYEIPYLAKPSSVEEKTLKLNDLFIKVENNEIVLFSEVNNKRIIPRKTHMYNHILKSIPLYHFLADLENDEGNRIIGIPTDELFKVIVFIPRLYFKNTIISLASWNFPKELLKDFKKAKDDQALKLIENLRERFQIPSKVLLIEGDNELLIDLDNSMSLEIFMNYLKNKDNIHLKEFLWTETKKEIFLNQYVASLTLNNNKKYATPLENKLEIKQTIRREFDLGTEWLYLKIYCGSGSVDLILTQLLLPFTRELTERKLIDSWFFIKYYDSDYHVRLRLHLLDPSKISDTLAIIYGNISNSKIGELIWRIKPDNYIRELERYGANTIELCESIFHIDSIIVIELIGLINNFPNSNLMTLLWGMKLIDNFLDCMNFSIYDKLAFVSMQREGYKREFKVTRDSTEIINFKYGTHKKVIIEVLKGTANLVNYSSIYELLDRKSGLQQNTVNSLLEIKAQDKLLIDFNFLTGSLVHMLLNRLITNKERQHEYLIYEFLVKYYNFVINTESKPAIC